MDNDDNVGQSNGLTPINGNLGFKDKDREMREELVTLVKISYDLQIMTPLKF